MAKGGRIAAAVLLCTLLAAPMPFAASAEGGSSFSWSSAALEGPVALRFLFTTSEAAKCAFQTGVANTGAPSGTQAVFYASQSRVLIAVGTGSGGVPVRAQAADDALDTETVVRSDRSATGWRGTFDVDPGAFNVTLVARDAGAWENRVTGFAAMALTLDCDKPVTLVGHEGSREVLMLDAQTQPLLHANAAAASAAVAAHQTRSFASPVVESTVSWSGVQVGRLLLDHPRGQDERVFAGSSVVLHRVGGPGTWGAQLDVHVGSVLSGYAGAIVGLGPIAGPDSL